MSNENNNDNNTKPSGESNSPSHSHGPAVNTVKKSNTNSSNKKASTATESKLDMVTITQQDFNKLAQEITFWKDKCSELRTRLDRIEGALIQVQGSIYNAKNLIISS